MLGSLILLGFFFYLIFHLFRIQRPKNFPPGPQPLPIFGSLLDINIKNPLKDFKMLAERYGNVYGLYLGRNPAVVLNGFKVIKEALVTKSADFSGRPQNILVSHMTEGKGVIMADYGPAWKEHRRFALMTLRNFGLGKQSMENRILGEIEHLVAKLEKHAGSILNPQTFFHNAASNIIYLVLSGIRYEYDNETLKQYIARVTENTKLINGPWSMRDNESSFDEDQLVIYILNLHAAGTDTTSNTLLTAFLYLMVYPDIQEKCQQEIDDVLQGKAQVSFEDRHDMPYTQAVIHESQRIANTVPLSVFHCTTRDTELMGYNIPKGTIIIPNLSSVLSEEGQWKFPNEFNPSNFLNEQGQFEKPEAFIPFSAGPRMCLGEGLARMELFLILVTLLRRFQFIWPEDAGEPDFTPVFGITLSPRPYRMGVRLRQSAREI
ncbi:cytochrome P450 2D14-like isoform X2 [Silurus meridionalis]|uniref:cytochrome P450 2D14-like isoform X2 n=1 Tax=Silurus meridionalis TaxID=175797 RepID=UPI001EECD57D|nr:cytochrome P450 2D14-like isoform X2 [Silurus meridionalis]